MVRRKASVGMPLLCAGRDTGAECSARRGGSGARLLKRQLHLRQVLARLHQHERAFVNDHRGFGIAWHMHRLGLAGHRGLHSAHPVGITAHPLKPRCRGNGLQVAGRQRVRFDADRCSGLRWFGPALTRGFGGRPGCAARGHAGIGRCGRHRVRFHGRPGHCRCRRGDGVGAIGGHAACIGRGRARVSQLGGVALCATDVELPLCAWVVAKFAPAAVAATTAAASIALTAFACFTAGLAVGRGRAIALRRSGLGVSTHCGAAFAVAAVAHSSVVTRGCAHGAGTNGARLITALTAAATTTPAAAAAIAFTVSATAHGNGVDKVGHARRRAGRSTC